MVLLHAFNVSYASFILWVKGARICYLYSKDHRFNFLQELKFNYISADLINTQKT